MAGNTPAANANSLAGVIRGSERATCGQPAAIAATTSASGKRLGRVRSASPAIAPAAIAAPGCGDRASSNASAHQPVAATSLMGWTIWNRKTGLVASSAAATTPAVREWSLAPSAYVQNTATAPSSGTTRNGPQSPATMYAAAIVSGSPGG